MKKHYKILRMLSVFMSVVLLSFCTSCQRISPVYSAGDSAFYVSLSRPENSDGDKLDDEAMYTVSADARSVFSSSLAALTSGAALANINSDVDVILDCDADILNILDSALALCERTGGLFQPCGGAYTSLVKNGSATKDELSAALTHVGADKFEISGSSIKKNDRLAAFDLYAVAEAVSLQKAVEHIKEQGVSWGTLSAGNTTAVFGEKPDGGKFNVALPDGEGYLGWFTVPSGYISYIDESSTVYDFGMGTNEFSRVAVYASDGITSAAIANAVWIGGIDGERRLAEALDGTYCMAAETKSGEVITSSEAISSGLFVLSAPDGEK